MNTQTDKKLGAFLGVYLPTILTILCIIMYLRVGWITGRLGLAQMIIIVIIAHIITLITTLSFSSVATNSRLGVGGAYYIISRSMGLEIGGAIGFPLFLSQAFSVTLYAYGLAEAMKIFWQDIPLQPATFIIIVVVGLLAFTGAKKALSTQIPILVLVGISILSLAIFSIKKAWGNPFPTLSPMVGFNFWTGFAIFFPAVTGVMAGLGLSGDLKDPKRSIPKGAILAVFTGFFVYLLIPVLLVMGASATKLQTDDLVWIHITVPYGYWLILPGLFGAVFSSAVGSMLGAPRTLQALAMDGIAPRILGVNTGRNEDLKGGLIVSIVISLGAVLLGDLNTVAPVVTVFFLTTYGIINFTAAFETLSGDPSWRPKLKIPWSISLFGGVVCVMVIFLIEPIAGVAAIVAELLLWLYLSNKKHSAGWGDARRGLYETMIRWALILLSRRPMSARNWRPHVLVFVSNLKNHLDLVHFGNWFSQGRGVVTVCEFEIGDLTKENHNLTLEKRANMKRVLDDEGLVVFPELHTVSDVVDGITNVAQANGMAGIESNIVLLGWPKEEKRLADFLRIMRRLEHLNKSMIIGRIQPNTIVRKEASIRTIHIWWGGLQRNGDLMLLLSYLLSRNPEWLRSKIQVMSIASDEQMKTRTENYLKYLLPEIRIDAEPRVVLKPEGESVQELIHKESKNADVVLFGLATPNVGEEEAYAKHLERLAHNLHTVFFVKNSSLFIGELVKQDSE